VDCSSGPGPDIQSLHWHAICWSAGQVFTLLHGSVALLGDSQSAPARKFLQHGGSLYTQLPGVVKPFHEVMEDRQKQARQEDLEPVAFSDLHSSSNHNNNGSCAVLKPAGRPLTGSQRYNNSIPHRSTGNFRPNTSFINNNDYSVYNNNNNLLQNNNKNSHNNNEAVRLKGMPTVLKPLDFGNLFSSQPEADYFPDPSNINNNNNDANNYDNIYSNNNSFYNNNNNRVSKTASCGEESLSGSLSNASEARSLVFNKNAEVIFSLALTLFAIHIYCYCCYYIYSGAAVS